MEAFYQGKKILVTGHTGFKGAWLSLWLLKLGASVAGYSLEPDTSPNIYSLFGLKNKMSSVIGDVRDREKLRSLFKDFNPEIVIHMAAQALVRRSYQDPVATYETNVLGTVNVLETCRESASVRAVVNVTSDKCYENNGGNRPFRETDPMGGHDPYSSSKGCAELVTEAYRRSFFPPEKYGKEHKIALASVRAGNVIGGGDWSQDRLMPDCVRAILSHESISIRYPNAVRPWQFVLDPLYGYLMLGQRLYKDGPVFSGPWNFGPGEENEKTVQWIVEKTHKLWGSGLPWKTEQRRQPHESVCLRLSSDKAGSLLEWHPQKDISSALRETVDWYKAWQDRKDMFEYSLKEIEDYMRSQDR